MIVIVDYNVGNIGSMENMLKNIGVEFITTSNPEVIEKASKIILPGVGAFDYAVKKLHELNLFNVLKKVTLINKIPLLGVCLGMQLLTKQSEEGELNGLNLINAITIKFNFKERIIKIPHMGWNNIEVINKNNIISEMDDSFKFYFVHSYYVKCFDEIDIVANTNYGIEFNSIIRKENIYGVQFHPEKSHKYGLKLLRNFIEYA